MSFGERIRHIGAELRGHAPFTLAGAILGVGFMLLFRNISKPAAGVLFGIFHPAHVVLSAIVTASILKLHAQKVNFVVLLIIGYVGSVGIATLSDCVIPFMGESVLGVAVPRHAHIHEHEGTEQASAEYETDHPEDEHVEHDNTMHEHTAHAEHRPKLHLGFVEQWYLVTPAAILGVVIAWFVPRTRFPHAAHVLISTWASSAHMLMNTEAAFTVTIAIGSVIVLFLAVWLPCCISDIVFPLLFVRSDVELRDTCMCTNHSLHSHPHVHEHTEACGGEGEANRA
ncbi:MAG TPA: hypothetical protein P5279_11625 [Anaerohalosphaeraceae bacterium]|nr:hypothetical protein [Anaerohalosphaeraceae bacterium]HRT51137.1 hypothetical protein [Anaerohalosphaeraceae bacterium]HRT87190.1 hypothetical protein [Anaerohalosphaeraceae bacterium]